MKIVSQVAERLAKREALQDIVRCMEGSLCGDSEKDGWFSAVDFIKGEIADLEREVQELIKESKL